MERMLSKKRVELEQIAREAANEYKMTRYKPAEPTPQIYMEAKR